MEQWDTNSLTMVVILCQEIKMALICWQVTWNPEWPPIRLPWRACKIFWCKVGLFPIKRWSLNVAATGSAYDTATKIGTLFTIGSHVEPTVKTLTGGGMYCRQFAHNRWWNTQTPDGNRSFFNSDGRVIFFHIYPMQRPWFRPSKLAWFSPWCAQLVEYASSST